MYLAYVCHAMTDYERIEKAIVFLKQNFKQQPDLDEVAKQVYLSPFHFQRLFKEWAGVSPKKFVQFLSVEYAKDLLKQNLSLLDTSFETGLSGTGRLHDLFINVEGMTPGEYKNGGQDLQIQYSFAETIFGDVIIASTLKGICYLSFVSDEQKETENLFKLFPNANFVQKTDLIQQNALKFFRTDWNDLQKIKLHLKGTPFQLKVWQSLLKIPLGKVSTYTAIANSIQNPGVMRAVGTAIGSNPVAFLIPCHRVIKSSGIVGEYHWGSNRKTAILGWEASSISSSN
ncbi:MAG TPA: methylated-DNA--[protein]-cysteine S-methyltransferase [Flavisolibacter sp.]|jgi:AraC family transcriptional regulator of adaptative response/methylated-DNA-[protein]-cysteine methyltransferase|nr:methylated-DNA--[protein]-cysteine S-methyltransferase [Flavisolibacter sp.]